jgi:hypothetical protein
LLFGLSGIVLLILPISSIGFSSLRTLLLSLYPSISAISDMLLGFIQYERIRSCLLTGSFSASTGAFSASTGAFSASTGAFSASTGAFSAS